MDLGVYMLMYDSFWSFKFRQVCNYHANLINEDNYNLRLALQVIILHVDGK